MSFMCASEEFNLDEFSNFLLRRPALEAAMVLIDSCPFSLQNCNFENGLYRHCLGPGLGPADTNCFVINT